MYILFRLKKLSITANFDVIKDDFKIKKIKKITYYYLTFPHTRKYYKKR